jgi:hypothetical protein
LAENATATNTWWINRDSQYWRTWDPVWRLDCIILSISCTKDLIPTTQIFHPLFSIRPSSPQIKKKKGSTLKYFQKTRTKHMTFAYKSSSQSIASIFE